MEHEHDPRKILMPTGVDTDRSSARAIAFRSGKSFTLK